jgi:thiamine-phosphate pyrophosphorylase
MAANQTLTDELPHLWLFSDARNDSALEQAMDRLPVGSALVYRHYHLDAAARHSRFDALSRLAQKLGHIVILSGEGEQALAWGAAGIYGPAQRLGQRLGQDKTLLRCAAAHDLAEVRLANQARADAVFLSPVFATRSHEGAKTLGIRGFKALAAAAHMPVIALGGMTEQTAKMLNWPRWGAIDGLALMPPLT